MISLIHHGSSEGDGSEVAILLGFASPGVRHGAMVLVY